MKEWDKLLMVSIIILSVVFTLMGFLTHDSSWISSGRSMYPY